MNVKIENRKKDDMTRFVCPECEGPCYIIDSRMTLAAGFRQRRRRYKCANCDTRFTTLERISIASIKTNH